MGTLMVFFLFALKFAVAEEVFDITTIYYVGKIYENTDERDTVEVQMRTNALEQSLTDAYHNVIDGSLEACTFKKCSWDISGWELGLSGFSFGRTWPTFSTYNLKSALGIAFRPTSDNRQISFKFALIMHTDKYSLTNGEYFSVFYFKRSSDSTEIRVENTHCFYDETYDWYMDGNISDFDVNTLVSSCDVIHQTYIEDLNWTDEYWTDGVVLDVIESSYNEYAFNMWADFNKDIPLIDYHKRKPNLNIRNINSKPNYVSVLLPQDNDADIGLKLYYRASWPNITNPQIVSPWFTAYMDVVCLAITVSGNKNIRMNVTAENTTGDSFLLGYIEEYLPVESAKILKFTSKLPDHLKESKIRILLTSVHSNVVLLERISSCSGDNGAKVVVFKTEELGITDKKAFNVGSITADDDAKFCSRPSTNLTSNGGCIRGAEYICPPGFTGVQCETACGSNRFGKDCLGLCSLYSRKCKGLLLCTPATSCQCAAGYSGDTCETNCDEFHYGNNCSQKCGRCKDQNSCDIYTGHCTSCESGYYPPYCKDTYPVVKYAPSISTSSFGEATVLPRFEFTGAGVPAWYQIQYKETNNVEAEWKTVSGGSYPDSATSHEVTHVITGLDHGKLYDVRVVLFSRNLNSYHGNTVPVKSFLSLCSIPEQEDYHITSESSMTSLTINWEYKYTDEYWCPVKHYEVWRREKIRWIQENTTETSFCVSHLQSGVEMKFKVRAFTSYGFAPLSGIVSVTTKLSGLGPVRNLSSRRKDFSAELVTWDPPENIGNRSIEYHLKYQCVKRIACSVVCDADPSHELIVANTNATLFPLLPLTRYLISVSVGEGEQEEEAISYLDVGTNSSLPMEIAEHSEQAPVTTNHSVTVFWKPVEVCSGFFTRYFYEFYKDGTLMNEGFTNNVHFTFDNLKPHTEHSVHIYIENNVGVNRNKYLQINVSTLGSVPEKVDSLTVYKRGRSILGLRWGMPKDFKGTLKSFTVVYGIGKKTKTKVVLPIPCVLWPQFFCHTLDNLNTNKNYTVTVAARNTEVPADGSAATVSAFTREGVPGPPENLKLVNRTSSSIAISWELPLLANGIIRSFIVSIEETEQYDSEKCCHDYPLMETFVADDKANYSMEISGLHPASTYTISISAKTLSFGSSVTQTIHTRPPPMMVRSLPKVLIENTEQEWLPQLGIDGVDNLDLYGRLIKGYILLVVFNSSSACNSGIKHEQLNTELLKQISNEFYLAAEYRDQGESIYMGTTEISDTQWGTAENRILNSDKNYTLAAVQISEYCSVYSVDIVWSKMFSVIS